MRIARHSPLFSAVVVAGASLTQAIGGCGGGVEPEEAEGDASVVSASEAGGRDAGSDGRSPFTPAEASAPDASAPGTCPDGSDQPVPPCVLIR